MNEGRQITKEQAEACMAQDWQFEVIPQPNRAQFRVKDGVMQVWCLGKGPWRDNDYYEAITEFPDPRIHADPNNTFERLFGTGELTFETSDEAAIWLIQNKGQQVIAEGSGVIYHVTWDGCMFTFLLGTKKVYFGFAPDYKYTIYKEPEPTPEPLTLEALEARVKALEERS